MHELPSCFHSYGTVQHLILLFGADFSCCNSLIRIILSVCYVQCLITSLSGSFCVNTPFYASFQ